MKLRLIEGEFERDDALEIITQMIHVKIKYHELKINNSFNEEDVKLRETKIKNLQKELYDLRNYLNSNETKIKINSQLDIELS